MLVSNYLTDRLGNVLFQIAAGFSYAREIGADYIIDVNRYFSNAYDNPLLDYKTNILKRFTFETLSGNIDTYYENGFTYQPLELTNLNSNNILLRGYFQSEKYFKKYRNDLLSEFVLQRDIDYSNCSAIHVRRGDYLKLSHLHPVQPISYYQKAIDILGTDKTYVVFSDDIDWCLQHFKGNNFIFHTGNYYSSISAMASCSNHIISNSTFSWWGAWLSTNVNKTVIAPCNWFGSSLKHNTKDLYFDNTIIL